MEVRTLISVNININIPRCFFVHSPVHSPASLPPSSVQSLPAFFSHSFLPGCLPVLERAVERRISIELPSRSTWKKRLARASPCLCSQPSTSQYSIRVLYLAQAFVTYPPATTRTSTTRWMIDDLPLAFVLSRLFYIVFFLYCIQLCRGDPRITTAVVQNIHHPIRDLGKPDGGRLGH